MVVNKFTLTQQHHRCYLSVPNTHITRASNRFLQEMMLSTKCCRLPELSILHICRQMAFPPDGGPWGVFLACYLQETFNGLSGLTFLSMLKMDNICANLMVHYLPMGLGFCFIHVSCPWTLFTRVSAWNFRGFFDSYFRHSSCASVSALRNWGMWSPI